MKRNLSLLVWRRITRIRRKHERAAGEYLRSWDLSTAQLDILTHLDTTKGITQHEVAEQLLVTKGNITQLLDKLEKRNLLARRPEGRTNALFLTDQGRQILEEVLPAHEQWHSEHTSGLTHEEQIHLLHLLRKLEHTMH